MRILLVLCLLLVACDQNTTPPPSVADAPLLTATSVVVQSTGAEGLTAKLPGQTVFGPLRESQPFPAGTQFATPQTARASVQVGDSAITLNHSTVMEVHAEKIVLLEGQLVVEHQGTGDLTLVTPHGEVVAHGGGGATKLAVVAGDKESTVTVTRGLAEVRHRGESFEARAGGEILLSKEREPVVTVAADLARQFDWSELTKRDEVLEQVPRGLGKLVGKTPGQEREHRLDLVDHRVDVKVQGNVAYTEIHESFRNPTSQTLEGVYRFPLPPDAQISRLSLKVGSTWMEGEFLATEHAERIWRDVIDQWRDPAMLKWKEGNTFELRIFPIDPHQVREIKIGYVQRLEPTSAGYRYQYPMPVDTAGLIPAKHFGFKATLHGHDPTGSLDVFGYPAVVEHAASEDDKPVTTVSWETNDFVARGDLGIRFARSGGGGIETYPYVEKDGQGYAVVSMRPQLPVEDEVRPRDFVVVLDTSYGRRGVAMDVQRKLAARMISEMDALDRVVVVACNHACKAVGSPDFRLARAATAQNVEAALADEVATGASYPVEALRVAGELFRRRSDTDREAHLVFFTDGIASAGEVRPGPLADAAHKVLSPHGTRTTIVDVGGDRDEANLDGLARGANGRVVSVDPNLSSTGQALAILSHHYRSLLSAPVVTAPAGMTIDSLLPVAVGQGDELVFAARFEGEPKGAITLSGTVGGKPFQVSHDVVVKAVSPRGNAFVPREWASQRIRALEMSGLDAGDPKQEIIRLSKQFGVLSRYTTLLALESREMMDEFGVRAQKRTEFRGDKAAELAQGDFAEAEPFEEMKSPAKKPSMRPSPKMKPPSRSRSKGINTDADSGPDDGFLGLPSLDGGGGRVQLEEFSSGMAMPIRRPRVGLQPAVQTRPAADSTAWEVRNVERKEAAHRADEVNRSKRMSLIRAQIRAGELRDARQVTEEWLQINPMDPEAIVQLAQLEAREGKVDLFLEHLLSAADAAPRGQWLIERIEAAVRADEQEALACAYKVTLEGIGRKPPSKPADILACPMTTVIETWFGGAEPADVPVASVSSVNGRVVVSLEAGDGSDWDIALVEPSGRLLWWGSARKRVKFSGVRAGSVESLALPSVSRGTYSILAIPRNERTMPTMLTVTVRADGKSKTVSARASEVAEIAEFELQ